MKDNLSVYIVDDSEETVFYLEDMIEENARVEKVTTFLDSEKALNSLLNKGEDSPDLPDLILLDVRMPELDGFEFIDEIDYNFKKFKPILIVLTSSKHRRDAESFEKQLVAKEFLNKPLENEDFEAILNKYF